MDMAWDYSLWESPPTKPAASSSRSDENVQRYASLLDQLAALLGEEQEQRTGEE
jgi:hypothetical protein